MGLASRYRAIPIAIRIWLWWGRLKEWVMAKQDPKRALVLARVTEIVRDLLDVEDALKPLLAQKAALEEELEPLVNFNINATVLSAMTIFPREPYPIPNIGAPPPPPTPAAEPLEPPSKMAGKPNPLECPFEWCRYEADTQDDLEDHVAGCAPNDRN